ncbi:MAG TPA: succinate dehydrogenase, cytochrome b556 subunit [Xanthobacteraceae bacterium]|nr:succinate dehydrogenase, cytochrome b556 subunit [Xanthobacteraceae bacterium]
MQAPVQRPLSPHLQIYRLSLSMLMSGLHRITGLALCAGMVVLAWWLLAAAAGQNAYGTFEAFETSWIGRLILFGFSWSLLHHLLGGLRYLIWDLGYGMEPAEREWLVRANIIGSILLTVLLWVILWVSGMR